MLPIYKWIRLPEAVEKLGIQSVELFEIAARGLIYNSRPHIPRLWVYSGFRATTKDGGECIYIPETNDNIYSAHKTFPQDRVFLVREDIESFLESRDQTKFISTRFHREVFEDGQYIWEIVPPIEGVIPFDLSCINLRSDDFQTIEKALIYERNKYTTHIAPLTQRQTQTDRSSKEV